MKIILIESSKMVNGICKPEEFNKWLQDLYSSKCIECKGTGSIKDKNNNFVNCSYCDGLGVTVRKHMLLNESCCNCSYFNKETSFCSFPKFRCIIQDSMNYKCASYLRKIDR